MRGGLCLLLHSPPVNEMRTYDSPWPYNLWLKLQHQSRNCMAIILHLHIDRLLWTPTQANFSISLLHSSKRKGGVHRSCWCWYLSSAGTPLPSMLLKQHGWLAGIVYGSVRDTSFVSHLQGHPCEYHCLCLTSAHTKQTARGMWGEFCWKS